MSNYCLSCVCPQQELQGYKAPRPALQTVHLFSLVPPYLTLDMLNNPVFVWLAPFALTINLHLFLSLCE